jgi:hypothetical protein
MTTVYGSIENSNSWIVFAIETDQEDDEILTRFWAIGCSDPAINVEDWNFVGPGCRNKFDDSKYVLKTNGIRIYISPACGANDTLNNLLNNQTT